MLIIGVPHPFWGGFDPKSASSISLFNVRMVIVSPSNLSTYNLYQPHPQPLSKGRGEWNALCIERLLLVIVKQNCFWKIVVRWMQGVRSMASINLYAEKKEDFCLLTMQLWLSKPNSVWPQLVNLLTWNNALLLTCLLVNSLTSHLVFLL